MRKALLFVAAALALVAKPVLAAEGPYVGANLGLVLITDSDIKIPGAPTQKAAYKSSFGFGLQGGYRFTDNVRLEVDFGYKKADIDTIDGTATNGDTSVAAYGFMANVYYDITQVKLPVTPFVGLGLGLVYGKISSPAIKIVNGQNTGGIGDRSDTEFGYQLTFGLAYAINKQATVMAFYRYQGSSDFSFTVSDPAIQTLKVKASYSSHNILAGLNYAF